MDHVENALEFLTAVMARDIGTVGRYLAPDATWKGAQSGPQPMSWDRGAFLEMLERLNTEFSTFNATFFRESVTATGERVSVEGEARGSRPNGQQYHQFYHFLVEFRGDQVVAVREYKA